MLKHDILLQGFLSKTGNDTALPRTLTQEEYEKLVPKKIDRLIESFNKKYKVDPNLRGGFTDSDAIRGGAYFAKVHPFAQKTIDAVTEIRHLKYPFNKNKDTRHEPPRPGILINTKHITAPAIQLSRGKYIRLLTPTKYRHQCVTKI